MGLFIYKITCTNTKKFYIGSTNNPIRRECEHFFELNRDTHHNKFLQHDYNKYGKSSFVFEVIESGFEHKQRMLLREYELIILTFKDNYNIAKEIPLKRGVKRPCSTSRKPTKKQLKVLKEKERIKARERAKKLKEIGKTSVHTKSSTKKKQPTLSKEQLEYNDKLKLIAYNRKLRLEKNLTIPFSYSTSFY